jgi:pimeloyl-ACP methyl ester carboxylesterase
MSSKTPIAFLPSALAGERFEFEGRAGRLSAYVAGSGPPLLLIHSINAAASAAEVRPLYEHYWSSRTVIALDLPGFGFSARTDRPYTPRLMTDAVHSVIEYIRARISSGPVDALALSLSTEYLARAAAEAPDAFRTLAFVSPTGLNSRRPLRGEPGSTLALPGLYRLLRGPGWGRGLYRLLTRPKVIRYFLVRTWGGPNIDERLRRYDVLTARQPGAEYAPLYFLSGGLFSGDIATIYEKLEQPVWMSSGLRGDFKNYRQQALVRDRRNWRFSVFDTGALPFFECPTQFYQDYDAFLAGRAGRLQGGRSDLRPAADGADGASSGVHELQDHRR